ncbi:MAG: hypothetical protein NW223_13510, partial [Hyphomicrobiaceae bacterium]|nr:hypothetical protein [Hyphomicrobiaceae bacterium]
EAGADAAQAAPGTAATPADGQPQSERREQGPRPHHGQQRREGRGGRPFDRNAPGGGQGGGPGQGDRGQGDRGRGGHAGKGGRPPQRFDRDRKRDDRPRAVMQAGPPAKSGGIDPDSPFAALSRLKAEMEKSNSK